MFNLNRRQFIQRSVMSLLGVVVAGLLPSDNNLQHKLLSPKHKDLATIASDASFPIFFPTAFPTFFHQEPAFAETRDGDPSYEIYMPLIRFPRLDECITTGHRR